MQILRKIVFLCSQRAKWMDLFIYFLCFLSRRERPSGIVLGNVSNCPTARSSRYKSHDSLGLEGGRGGGGGAERKRERKKKEILEEYFLSPPLQRAKTTNPGTEIQLQGPKMRGSDDNVHSTDDPLHYKDGETELAQRY